MRAVIEADGVGKIYRSRDGESGLRELSLHANQGEILALLGPNGAGKTTAVKGLATLVAFDRGTARVCGYDVSTEAARVRDHIGLVGQDAAVDEQLTAGQNLRFFGRLRGLGRRSAGQRADELIEEFGLCEAQNRAVSSFSGGMRRRLDLAASLVVPPRVLFVDEPTTGLDPAARRDLWKSLRDLVHGGTMILLTTQYLEEADQLADRIVLIDRGKVAAQGSPGELKTLVGPPVVQVVFETTDDARNSLRILGATLTEVSLDENTSTITLPKASATVLGEVIATLASAGLPPAEVTLRKPSLDEVFLTLTGDHSDTEGNRQ
ncbi:ATP-binding cassette domain-containing protein [Corynebacterium pacaense]|uniref:ATP-binding cassette domain-containing protein n=1 Tax=Corynebacterium pacaense TaxID=1816684 RepID=UPI0009BB57A7|nr:ATP-binding cassette domain-containing protein [Corynebacterium pacaense]